MGKGSKDGRNPLPRRLKIAFVVADDHQTGTYFRYHNLARALIERGHEVTVHSQSSRNRWKGTRETRDGVPYVLNPTVPGNSLLLPATNPLNALRRLWCGIPDSHVYHLFQPFATGAIPWLWQRRRGGLFVYDWDDYWLNETFGLAAPKDMRTRWAASSIGWLEKLLPSKCHLLTTLSHALEQLARQRGCTRTAIIYNGVWPQKRVARSEARRQLGLQADALYVGLMGYTGGASWCLAALQRHAAALPRLRLAICGGSPENELRRFPDVRHRVDYLGVLPSDRVPILNAALDLGLVPMEDNLFNRFRLPYKLTDHLSGGTPVLCCRVGEAAVVGADLPGITLCAPTLEAWSEAFRDAITRLSETHVPARVPVDSILARFSWPVIAARTESEYRAAAAPLDFPPTSGTRRTEKAQSP